ncbi:MAG: plasmid partitioning protein RepB [Microlunatus sp.]
MARKNLLASVTASLAEDGASPPLQATRSEYTRRGASRSMLQSLDEMAENSLKVLQGEAVVSLDPVLLEASFVGDRLEDDDAAYVELRDAIKKSGQSSPILVRPHPDEPSRYMIVFGHRRARVARELGIQVRAVVRPLEEIEHIVAQGQENTARVNLSFIEKALFGHKLQIRGVPREAIRAALTVDDTLLYRMLAVVEGIPTVVLEAIGSAKGVGRDRWDELKRLLQPPAASERAIEFVGTGEFLALAATDRFHAVLAHAQVPRKPKRVNTQPSEKAWSLPKHNLKVVTKEAAKSFSLTLKAPGASRFGVYLSSNLERLYEAFQEAESEKKGD